MNKILLGMGLGIGTVCLYKYLKREGYIDDSCCVDAADRFVSKSRRGIKNVMDAGMNEAEYLKERAEYAVNKGKNKLDDMME